MLIQNVGSTAQAPQPTRHTGDSAPDAVAAPQAAAPQAAAPQAAAPQAAAPQAAAKPAPLPAEQLQGVVDNINKTLKQANRNLEFSVDESTNKQVVKLVDNETGDVIRQYPSEEMLAVSRSLDQFQHGSLLKQKA